MIPGPWWRRRRRGFDPFDPWWPGEVPPSPEDDRFWPWPPPFPPGRGPRPPPKEQLKYLEELEDDLTDELELIRRKKERLKKKIEGETGEGDEPAEDDE